MALSISTSKLRELLPAASLLLISLQARPQTRISSHLAHSCDEYPPDLASDLAPDLASDLAPDLASDLASNLAPDLAPALAPALALALAPDLAPDLAPGLALDFSADFAPDLALDLASDLTACLLLILLQARLPPITRPFCPAAACQPPSTASCGGSAPWNVRACEPHHRHCVCDGI